MKPAVFLDRDGTLNEDTMYPHKIHHFKMLPGVIDGLKKLSKKYIFVIITNQSGIGRGVFKEEDFQNFNNHLITTLKKEGIEIKKTYHCPHTSEQVCECRKPSAKYINDAAEEFGIDIKKSWVIGDHLHDLEMGINAGCRSVYMLTGHGKMHINDIEKSKTKPDFTANNFLEAANFIMGQ
ncbi:MAG: HAD family hydrolase [Nanoarchaeota archaeon]